MSSTFDVVPTRNLYSQTVCLPSTNQALLHDLTNVGIVVAEDLEDLPQPARDAIQQARSSILMLDLLRQHGLISDYQHDRLRKGKTDSLVIGNYRILAHLCQGGMGNVYRAEHIFLRRTVALKVLFSSPDEDVILIKRFFQEMRTIARLQHPNVVGALDAGTWRESEHDSLQYFFVMEYYDGSDLEGIVGNQPLTIAKACDYMFQAASGLEESHKNHLVHRDIKPSNLFVTKDGVVKLLDFGLARAFHNRRLTEPGTVLGTLNYMAPEQASDSASVDIRADIFGLGATMYYCLAGEPPFAGQGTLTQLVIRRQSQTPPDIRLKRPDISDELAGVISRMMSLRPEDRFQTPHALMRALLPHVRGRGRDSGEIIAPSNSFVRSSECSLTQLPAKAPRILIVDDSDDIRELVEMYFEAEGFECMTAVDGAAALDVLQNNTFDVILLDVEMPRMSGRDVLLALREQHPDLRAFPIMMSGGVPADQLAELLAIGAQDFLSKPLSKVQLIARVKSAIQQKEAMDRADMLNHQLLNLNSELEKALGARNSDLVNARNALVFSLASLVEHRSNETTGHLVRIQKYSVALAEEAACIPTLGGQINPKFVKMLECCAPLHDIGNVALPDSVLLKDGLLTTEDRLVMQTHTSIGAQTLEKVARRHGSAVAFLRMAIDICHHHHERFDGKGYPDRLSGNNIPLAARIVAIADVYDALRTRWKHRPALPHQAALEMMCEGSPGQFDPLLLEAMSRCHKVFEQIFRDYPDGVDY